MVLLLRVISAVRRGDVQRVSELASASDADDWTALHEAALCGQTLCVQVLLKGQSELKLNQCHTDGLEELVLSQIFLRKLSQYKPMHLLNRLSHSSVLARLLSVLLC